MDNVLEQLNHTELVALAQLNEIPGASMAATREQLIEALTTMEPIDVHNPVSGLALKISKWLNRWWDRFKDTAPKKCCPDCPGCNDLQILDCYNINKRQLI